MSKIDKNSQAYEIVKNFLYYILYTLLSPIIIIIPTLITFVLYNNVIRYTFNLKNLAFLEIWSIFIIIYIIILSFVKFIKKFN
jgi:hypothetical protein